MALPSSSVVLAAFPTGPKSETRISLDTHGGRRFVNVRCWYLDGGGTWRPTRRGVTVRPDALPRLLEALAKAVDLTGAP